MCNANNYPKMFAVFYISGCTLDDKKVQKLKMNMFQRLHSTEEMLVFNKIHALMTSRLVVKKNRLVEY